ncbi:Hypothetical protein SMAX5B_008048 [Scophthalmus maximus]|uniref:Uncharacterized protein n=1 Tax=Scophthalmus maximus TaxID=52904 RepID=A0A2U9BEY6_SCOMX|nr:Hypothetical protein SMAX5B_008048 [Scophthalmus maximus]
MGGSVEPDNENHILRTWNLLRSKVGVYLKHGNCPILESELSDGVEGRCRNV